MFRIEFFVDDKMLAMILRAIAGKVHDLKTLPVANVAKKNGKLVAKTGGKLHEQLIAYIIEKKLTTFNVGNVRDFLNSVGSSPSSASYVLKQAMDADLVKRSGTKGNAGIYSVKKG